MRRISWQQASSEVSACFWAELRGEYGKGSNGHFWLMRPLLNGYGEKVNGSLIHANRLAFGRVWDYLCIVAAP